MFIDFSLVLGVGLYVFARFALILGLGPSSICSGLEAVSRLESRVQGCGFEVWGFWQIGVQGLALYSGPGRWSFRVCG